jgi:hypothetical protein
LIFSLISSMTHLSFSNELFCLQLFEHFPDKNCYFCCWVLVLLHCDQIVCKGYFNFLLFVKIFCALRCALFWRKFHGLLRRMYTVLL